MTQKPRSPSRELVTKEEQQATFDRQLAVMKMFSDNAKTYIQLSGAALGLTLTFAHKIIHIPEDQPIVDLWMVTMWSCFLITIIAGAFYQYLAAKFMEASIDWEYDCNWNWLEPGVIYGVMLGAFYAGTTVFTIYAITRLRHLG
jgi:hypothetical protein